VIVVTWKKSFKNRLFEAIETTSIKPSEKKGGILKSRAKID
jgi:hypothetical protein